MPLNSLLIKNNTGQPGPPGPQGAIGNQGATGATGGTGSTGATGNQGAIGSQGFQGPTGSQGAGGAVGPQGPQGFQGVSVTGPQGPQGIVGGTGPQGAVGSQGASIVGPQGSQGSVGIPGNQGPQGVTGGTGSQGAIGPQGAIGGIGPQGVQGSVGLQGAQGVPGNQGAIGGGGPQGSPGPQGVPGTSGGPGVQGATGTQGSQGPQGATVTGPQGTTGNQGPQGFQGSVGTQGATGPQGNQGSTGLPNGTTNLQLLAWNGTAWIASNASGGVAGSFPYIDSTVHNLTWTPSLATANAGSILWWNGSTWVVFGNGLNSSNANQAAVWSGTQWSTAPIVNSIVAGSGISISASTGAVTINSLVGNGSNVTWPSSDSGPYPANVWTLVGGTAGIALPAGTWLILGKATIYDTASINQTCELGISTSSTGMTATGWSVDGTTTVTIAGSNYQFQMNVMCFTTISAPTTVYLMVGPTTNTTYVKRASYNYVTGMIAIRLA